jgi:hypothetical protein
MCLRTGGALLQQTVPGTRGCSRRSMARHGLDAGQPASLGKGDAAYRPGGNYHAHHSLSDLNNLGELRFVEAIMYVTTLLESLLRLKGKLLTPSDACSKLTKMQKAMLTEARLLDCLFTETLVAADAHEKRRLRRSVIDQINPFGYRSVSQVGRLEMALEAPLCSIIETDLAATVVGGGGSSASNGLRGCVKAISVSEHWKELLL